MGWLRSGSHLLGRIALGVWVSASFHMFTLRMLLWGEGYRWG